MGDYILKALAEAFQKNRQLSFGLLLFLIAILSLCLRTCGNDTVTPSEGVSAPPPTINTGIVVEYDFNLFAIFDVFNIYDVRTSVDDVALGTQIFGEIKLYNLTITEGEHKITFSEVGDNTNTTTEAITVSEGDYYYYSVKARGGGIEIEKRDTMTKDEALAFLEQSQPTDSASSSEVSQTPSQESEAPSEQPSEPSSSATQENDAPSEQPVNEPTSSSSAQDNANDILHNENITIDNNENLSALFSKGGDENLCQAFVSQYSGQVIEFDGCIASMSHHETYTTRYDILIYAGNYGSDASNKSPAMQFNNVNMSDLHFTGNVPDHIGQGDNLHITAEIEGIVNGYLILLDPVSISIR